MVKSHVGDFVTYADYGRLQDEVARLQQKCKQEYESGYKCGYGIAMTEKKTMEAICKLTTEAEVSE